MAHTTHQALVTSGGQALAAPGGQAPPPGRTLAVPWSARPLPEPGRAAAVPEGTRPRRSPPAVRDLRGGAGGGEGVLWFG
ncbi:hypothetical protein, partial [Streptomyces sp. NTH33]|uniref:hypothetical protein n=1 Tax=Streptomyces sp. NTH33 TaxID=1735453 RepID=UPI003F8DEAEC